MGATLNRLEPDPETAPVVRRIFRDRLAGAGYSAIAGASTPKASPHRRSTIPQRNSHRERARMGGLRRPRDPPQRPLHRPRGLRTATTRLRPDRRHLSR